jgi:BT1 family
VAAQETQDTKPTVNNGTVVRAMAFLILTVAMGAVITAITGLKTSLLIKEQLGLGASEYNTLMLVIGIPSYLQPFIGMWTDMFDFLGYHRRTYYLAGKLLGVAGLFILGYLELTHRIADAHSHSPAAAIGCLLVISAGGIMRTVIFNALLVVIGNLTGRFGQFVALVNLIPIVLGLHLTATLSGYVADHWSYEKAFFVGGIITLLSTPLVFLIQEKRVSYLKMDHESEDAHQERLDARQAGRAQILASTKALFARRDVRILILFVFYLILTPGINNTKLYFERDWLHFTGANLGKLAAYANAGALFGYGLYVLLSRRVPVCTLAVGAWLMDCASYPFFLLLHSMRSAQLMEFAESVIGALYSVFLYTLAARMCPKGLESAVYGLVQSAIAISSNLSEIIGSRLYESFGPQNLAHKYSIQHGWNWSVYLGFLFTVPAVALIPLLPAWTWSKKRVGDLTDEDVHGVP